MLGDFVEQGGIRLSELVAADWCRELIESLAGQLSEPLERPVKRLEAAIDFVEAAGPEIDRPAIMARKQQGCAACRRCGL